MQKNFAKIIRLFVFLKYKIIILAIKLLTYNRVRITKSLLLKKRFFIAKLEKFLLYKLL